MKLLMKKKVLSILFLGSFSALLLAVPAKRDVIRVTQSDGTSIAVQLRGDEFFHYTTTDDGLLIQQNAQGIYEYAELDESTNITSVGIKAHSVAERSHEETLLVTNLKNNQVNSDVLIKRRNQSPLKRGVTSSRIPATTKDLSAKGLVILVNFSNKAMAVPTPNTAFFNMLNASSYTTGSAKKYFYDQSSGAFNPDFDVYGPYTLPQTLNYYGQNVDDNDRYAAQMILDACSLAYSNGVNFTPYDTDNDGYVDNVYVVYAGYGEASGAPANTIWPHRWIISSAMTYGSCSGNYQFGTKKIEDYACSSELSGTSGSTIDGIGTFCHEFGHVIGMPDYYDTSGGSNKTVASWNIMDYGCYNNDGNTPPNYSIYDRWFMGWATPTIMNAAENVVLMDLGTSNSGRIVTTNGTMPSSPFSTSIMYLFENRQQTGWDTYLPSHGMLVTKVRYNSSAWDNNSVNSGSTMYYDIIEADGSPTSWGDGGDVYPGAQNVTSYTPTSTYPLTVINESNTFVTFKFMGGDTTKYSILFDGDNCTIDGNALTRMDFGSTFVSTITPEAGYALTSADFIITMGGVNISDFTYSGTTLTVPNVTGNLEIIVVANLISGMNNIFEVNPQIVMNTEGTRIVNLPDNAHVCIYDVSGRVVIDKTPLQPEMYCYLQAGVYVVKISVGGQIIQLKALCK